MLLLESENQFNLRMTEKNESTFRRIIVRFDWVRVILIFWQDVTIIEYLLKLFLCQKIFDIRLGVDI